jgi:hypothetical protein
MFRLLPLIILAFTFNVFSQTIKVSSAKNGKVRITNGKSTSIINLSRDVSGCFSIFDGTDPERRISDGGSFQLIDSVKKNNKIYLLLQIAAQGNCNVQGMCGAAVDTSIVWLKLNQNLQLIDKKAFVWEDCIGQINPLTSKVNSEGPGRNKLRLKNGKLLLKTEKNLYSETEDYEVSSFVYDHKSAEKGFMVKAEKPPRPKN